MIHAVPRLTRHPKRSSETGHSEWLPPPPCHSRVAQGRVGWRCRFKALIVPGKDGLPGQVTFDQIIAKADTSHRALKIDGERKAVEADDPARLDR